VTSARSEGVCSAQGLWRIRVSRATFGTDSEGGLSGGPGGVVTAGCFTRYRVSEPPGCSEREHPQAMTVRMSGCFTRDGSDCLHPLDT